MKVDSCFVLFGLSLLCVTSYQSVQPEDAEYEYL